MFLKKVSLLLLPFTHKGLMKMYIFIMPPFIRFLKKAVKTTIIFSAQHAHFLAMGGRR